MAQCGYIGIDDFLRLKLFPLSLSKIAFTWYTNLPPSYVGNQAVMEKQFHFQSYRMILEVLVNDLTEFYQYNCKSVDQFIALFKKAKIDASLCFQIKTFKNLAFNGLKFNLREILVGLDFSDLFQLVTRVLKYELLLKDRDDGSHEVFIHKVALMEI